MPFDGTPKRLYALGSDLLQFGTTASSQRPEYVGDTLAVLARARELIAMNSAGAGAPSLAAGSMSPSRHIQRLPAVTARWAPSCRPAGSWGYPSSRRATHSNGRPRSRPGLER